MQHRHPHPPRRWSRSGRRRKVPRDPAERSARGRLPLRAAALPSLETSTLGPVVTQSCRPGPVRRPGVPCVRRVKTWSGATARRSLTQRGRAPDIEHIGSAHHDAELEVLKAAARQRSARRPTTTKAPWAITECDPIPRVLRREPAADRCSYALSSVPEGRRPDGVAISCPWHPGR